MIRLNSAQRRPVRRRGVSMVLIVVSTVALLALAALVVDLSLLHLRRQRAVNGCDAAAMAGALELPSTASAQARAIAIASANGLPGSVSVDFPAANQIEVRNEENVALGLARIVGISSGKVTAVARASRDAANVIHGNAPCGVRPWGLSSTFAIRYTGQTIPLKLGSRSDTGGVTDSGDFYSLRLGDATGAGDYATAVRDGGTADYRIGDLLDTEPGNKVGPTRSGVDYLLDKANVAPWSSQSPPNVSADNPRVILMPIVDWSNMAATHQVRIVGFAAVYLIGMSGQSVQGIFLQHISPANAGVDPGLPPGPEDGVLVTRLVE